MRVIDVTGKVFGRLTVLGRAENTPKGQAQWLCKCECGTERVIAGSSLRQRTRSCGCLIREATTKRSTKHGHATDGIITPTYHSWAGMVARCTNPNHGSYARYGERGIEVYEPWLKFANFLADMGEKPPGTSLDRIDNNGNYEPGNCRWATQKRQARNKSNNHNVTFRGETHSIAEWAERLGIRAATINDRLASGWNTDKALSTPDGTVSNNTRTNNLTLNGQTRTLSEWSRHTGIPIPTICRRLKRGWSVEKSLSG